MKTAESQLASTRMPLAAWAVVVAGVAAALHLGKLPPAVPALQSSLGIDLVEAGFLLSLVQVAGMTLGLWIGLAADAVGLRKTMLAGLVIVTLAGALGAMVGTWGVGNAHAVPLLLVLRAVEGVGFLLAVMPGPGLIRALSPAAAEKRALGLWGAYMPLGVALALLAGPAWIGAAGWPGWWWAIAVVSGAAAVWVALVVPADHRSNRSSAAAPQVGWLARLHETVGARGPQTIALAFAVYSSQWMAVIGFLPSVYAAAGVPPAWSAPLTALAAAANIVGNVAGGRLLQRGVAPANLLRWGFVSMALGSLAAFVQLGPAADAVGLPPALRYLAVCVFSLGGGMVPATLFLLAVRLAPGPATVSTTVGLMQQASSLGQFIAPPFVAWVAHRVGGWQWTWVVTLACSLVGLALASRIALTNPRIGAA